MAKQQQKDNSTLSLKVSLRRNLLREIDRPVVLETHGGFGHIYDRCYRDVSDGVVFEKVAKKVEFLALQRREWAVYECDSAEALRDGVGRHLAVNYVDVDPYGEPSPVIDAFLAGHSVKLPDYWAIAVYDGLMQNINVSGGWNISCPIEVGSHVVAAALKRN